MADGFTVKLEGVDALNRALADATKQIRTKAVRAALRKAGQVISKEAKRTAPVLSAPTKTRKPGTVKRAISVRASKAARQDGNEGVFIAVKPLKNDQIRTFKKSQAKRGSNASGSKNPNDPYYWWWVEFGHRAGKADRSDRALIEKKSNTKDSAQKARLRATLEKTSKRKQVAPRPFFRPAFDTKKGEAQTAIANTLRAAIDAEWAKLK